MENREKIIVKTSLIGIIGNILLVSFKALIGFIAGSISIIMDALNNLTDALSSIITIIGTKLSEKKPTKKHPYGFGRIEYITSSIIAALILFAGFMAIYESINSIIDHFNNGTMPEFELYSITIIAVAIFVKVGLGLLFKRQGKKVNSDNLKASGTDALFDSILSTSTLIGAIFAYSLNIYIEGYLGIVIGLFILRSGFEIMKDAISSILGIRFDKEIITNIKKDINEIPGVLGTYDLILNSYGHDKIIGSVHITVKDELTAKEIQVLERNISGLLFVKYNALITVGVYAENNDEESKIIKNELVNILKGYQNVLQNHGFYIDKDKKTCTFDLVISFDEDKPETIISEVKDKLNDKFPEYTYVIQFDQDFSLS